jgi:hypothetical protein
MANTQAIPKTFRLDLMNGLHAFGATVIRAGTTKDSFKAALYLASATIDATATAYTATGEVTGTGYTAGGIAVTNATEPANTGGTGIVSFWTPSASLAFGTVTLAVSFDCVMFYNNTAAGKNAVSVNTFGATTVTAATFTLTMPTNDLTTGLLRLS